MIVDDPNAPPPSSCATQRAAPVAHISAGRAVFGGTFNLRALANAGRRDIGLAWDFFSQVTTLQEGAAGQWYATAAPACTR